MSAGKRIRKLREKHDVSQEKLSKDLGYKTYTTVSKWESGASLPPGRELTKLATYFNVSTDYILGLDTIEKINHSSDFSDTVELDYIKPKTLNYIEKNIIKDKIDVPRYLLEKEAHNYFVANIQTESMNRVIPSGNSVLVLISPEIKNPPLKTGDVIIVRKNDQFKIRYLRKKENEILLEPASHNDEYQADKFSLQAFDELEIIGQVIYTFRDFQF